MERYQQAMVLVLVMMLLIWEGWKLLLQRPLIPATTLSFPNLVETLIFNTATSDDDIYLDYTDALLCGNGVMDVGNNSPNTPEIQYFNGATIAQICPDIQITGCTTCPETGTGTFTLATIQKFIAAGSVWKYLDDGSDQGTAWFGTSFDDSGWASGNAELGYGDGDEVTTVSYGGDPNDKHETTYFRQSFSVTDPNDYASLELNVLRDDGAVVYINGSEVARFNMPTGSITFTTLASSVIGGAEEDRFFTVSVSTSLLNAGSNIIAVEIHQANVTSSDISFDLQLVGVEPNPLPVELIYFTTSSGPTGVSLEWATASEENNDFFIVEHSVDGYQFKSIAKIEGHGNRKNLTHYRIVDHNPYPGLNYYRLKQVDYDGSIDYSDIVSISIDSNYDIILLFPNPSSDFIRIKSRTDVSVRGIVIRNILGQVINVPVASGETGIVLDVHLLPRGTYFVNINAGSNIVTKRVIIER